MVVSRPDTRRGRGNTLSPSPVKAVALELGLPVTDDLDAVLDAGIELGVVVAYGRIIPRRVLEAVPMVNLHFSLLPRWRGAAPVERALLAGDATTGVCLMEVAEGLDTGAVYAVEETSIAGDDTLASLRGRLVEMGTRMVVDALTEGLGAPAPQTGEPTHAAKIDPGELALDWSRPAVELDRLVRLGGAWTPFRGKRLKVWKADLLDDAERPEGLVGAAPGTLDGTVVAAGVRCPPPGRGPARGQGPPGRRGLAQRQPPGARRTAGSVSAPGVAARQLAVDALVRIDSGGAYANLTLPPMLERSGLSDRDRAFVTELVYGTTRMQRSCDWLVDRFLPDPGRIDATARAWLRLGAFQLAFLDTPPHAAVGATVESAPKKLKGLCNAVLRKVAPVPAGRVARRRHPPQPARLDHEPAHHRPRPRCRRRRARGDEPSGRGHDARRRLRAGPRLPVGRRGRGRRTRRPRARRLRRPRWQGHLHGGTGRHRGRRRRPRRSGRSGHPQRRVARPRPRASGRGGRRRHRPAVPSRLVRQGPARRPLLGPGCPPPSARRPLAHRPRRRRPPRRAAEAPAHGGPRGGAARGRGRLQRVHGHRRRDRGPRRLAGRHPPRRRGPRPARLRRGPHSVGAPSCCRRPPVPTACTCFASACPRPDAVRARARADSRP